MLFSANVLRNFVAAFNVRNLLDHGVIEQAGGEDGAQNAMDVSRSVHPARLRRSRQPSSTLAEEDLAGLLHVEAGVRGLGGGVRAAPVGETTKPWK
jgi:hypothetical protein